MFLTPGPTHPTDAVLETAGGHRMSKSRTSFRRRLLRAGIATAIAAAAAAAVTTPAYATTVPLTLSTSSASDTAAAAGTVNVVASSTAAWLTAATTTSAKVLFNTATACATTYGGPPATATAAGNLTKYSAYRGSFVAPTTFVLTAATTYRVCVYAGSSSGDALIGNSTFTIFTAPVITGTDITAGPSTGGTLMTATASGGGLPTTVAGYGTITLGGNAVAGLTAVNATTFSFLTPPHAASTAAEHLIVALASGGTQDFTTGFQYYSSITVTPNSGLYNNDIPVYITGGGFTALNAFGLINAAAAHIYLTKGAYVPTDGGAGIFAAASVPMTNCTSPVKLSDTEIICTLALTASIAVGTPWTSATPVARGAYTVSLVNDATILTATVSGASKVTPSSTFTVTDYP
jgi:hypothetical protein